MQWFSGSFFQAPGPPTAPAVASTAPPAAASTAKPTPGSSSSKYAVGEVVEYFSASTKNWITGKVLQVNADGTYSLDVKPNASADKIRKYTGSATSSSAFAVGEMVDYFSGGQGKWIPAKVLKVLPNGTYDLDCKTGVSADKIRTGRAPAPKPKPKVEAMKLAGPIQLLRVSSSGFIGTSRKYEVCADGAKALESWGTRRISVATMCGPQRTGKSYLLNLLLERIQKKETLFKVGNTTHACTEGIWLWGSADSADNSSPIIVYLDCQGIGGDQKSDEQLMALCGLLSSVLLLNTKGDLNSGVFDQLSACNFAQNIEEHGNEANRPMLLWVLHDSTLDRGQAPDQYLEQTLQSGPSDNNGAGREVRQDLLRFFGRRSCTALVQPVGDNNRLQSLTSVPYTSLRGEFRTGVEALQTQLRTACKGNPKAIGGQALTCFAFAALLRKLVETLNNGKSLHVKGVWEQVQHTACHSVADDIRGDAHAKMRALASGQPFDAGGLALPLADAALLTLFQQNREDCRQTWNEKAVGDEHVRNDYWKEIEESLSNEERMVKEANTRTADMQLTEALRPWQEWLESDKGSWDRAPAPPADQKDVPEQRSGSQIARDFGELLDRMPAGPLSRAALGAIEAAGRRVDAVRGFVSSAMLEKNEALRKHAEIGDASAKSMQELYAARDKLALVELMEKDLKQRTGELEDAKTQIKTILSDMEATREKEREAHRHAERRKESEETMRLKLEDETRARERMHRDFHQGRERHEAELEKERHEKKKHLSDLESIKDRIARTRQLELELEEAKGHVHEKRKLELEIQEQKMRIAEKERHLEEKEQTHKRELELHRKELELEQKGHADVRGKLAKELEEKAAAHEFSRMEVREVVREVPVAGGPDTDELERRYQALKDDHARSLRELDEKLTRTQAEKQELAQKHEELAKKHQEVSANPENQQLYQEMYNRYDRERKARIAAEQKEREAREHSEKMAPATQTSSEVLERERKAGKLEGELMQLRTRNKELEEEVDKLLDQVRQAEVFKGQHQREKEQLTQSLKEAKAEVEALKKTEAPDQRPSQQGSGTRSQSKSRLSRLKGAMFGGKK